jgi:hypothetical protein
MAGQTTLHLLRGRVASGKSKLFAKLCRHPGIAVIRPREPLVFGRYSEELRPIGHPWRPGDPPCHSAGKVGSRARAQP